DLDVQYRTWDPVDGLSWEQTGNVHVEHALDLDQSPGGDQGLNPRLVYNSDSVSVHPVLQATFLTDVAKGLPSGVDMDLTWDGVAQPAHHFATTGRQAGEQFTVATRVAAPVTQTGRHLWSVTVHVHYADPTKDYDLTKDGA